MIDYITTEPLNEMDQKSSFKFPYFSSEILTSENVFIIDKFFEEEEVNESRKNSDIQKEEIKIMNSGSSEIEININDDNNNENEIKEKSNNLKETKDLHKNLMLKVWSSAQLQSLCHFLTLARRGWQEGTEVRIVPRRARARRSRGGPAAWTSEAGDGLPSSATRPP